MGEKPVKIILYQPKSKNSTAGKTTQANLVYLYKMIQQAIENFLSIPFAP